MGAAAGLRVEEAEQVLRLLGDGAGRGPWRPLEAPAVGHQHAQATRPRREDRPERQPSADQVPVQRDHRGGGAPVGRRRRAEAQRDRGGVVEQAGLSGQGHGVRP